MSEFDLSTSFVMVTRPPAARSFFNAASTTGLPKQAKAKVSVGGNDPVESGWQLVVCNPGSTAFKIREVEEGTSLSNPVPPLPTSPPVPSAGSTPLRQESQLSPPEIPLCALTDVLSGMPIESADQKKSLPDLEIGEKKTTDAESKS